MDEKKQEVADSDATESDSLVVLAVSNPSALLRSSLLLPVLILAVSVLQYFKDSHKRYFWGFWDHVCMILVVSLPFLFAVNYSIRSYLHGGCRVFFSEGTIELVYGYSLLGYPKEFSCPVDQIEVVEISFPLHGERSRSPVLLIKTVSGNQISFPLEGLDLPNGDIGEALFKASTNHGHYLRIRDNRSTSRYLASG